MKQSTFQLVSQTLSLPAASAIAFTERGLVFSDKITDTDLIGVGHRLFAVKSYLNWAIGSFFNEMLRRRTDNATLTTDDSWLLEFCETLRVDPKLRREVIEVFRFYLPLSAARAPALAYDYYREAYWGTSNGQPDQLKRALAYLTTAADRALTVTELRLLMRSSQATEQPDTTQTQFEGYGVIFDFRRLAARELSHLNTYTPERAALLLSDLGDAIAFIDGLRALAAPSHAKAV